MIHVQIAPQVLVQGDSVVRSNLAQYRSCFVLIYYLNVFVLNEVHSLVIFSGTNKQQSNKQ